MREILGRPIFQYAWVVNDLEAAAARWAQLFKAGPFFFNRHHRVEEYFRYRGGSVQADVSYAFAYCGEVQIQLCQMHDEQPSIFREMFAPGREGFHHVAILGGDYQVDRQHLLDNGLELALEMWGGADVAYFDARPQIGCFVELHDRLPAIDAEFARWKRSHDEWDGVTDLVREIDVHGVESAGLQR